MHDELKTGIRGRILNALSRDEPRSISGIARRSLTMRLTATNHLEKLKEEGLVREFAVHSRIRLFILAEKVNVTSVSGVLA